MARTMLIGSGLAKNFWAEAVNTAYYLVNRCMIRSILNKTPYELLNRRKPKLTYLRTFGCKCYVLNNGKDQLDMMSQMKEANEDNTASSSTEPSTLITTTEAEERVVDAVQGTSLASKRRIEENRPNIPYSSQNKPQSSNWRHLLTL
uniref:Retrovirus-related Pol polyprotein from transposon TNT 1-94 n=1 Tax=Nicotiana tabacum TaxID=4097 RepID=A0A1S4AFN4_TOBAC|nr:PREDICTED: uncharacterized protein LOC107797086 [Nicotiana tabacum]